MELASARDLQAELLRELRLGQGAREARCPADGARSTTSDARDPQAFRGNRVSPGIAIGICMIGSGYGLAIRVQDPALVSGPLLDSIVARAHGEVDVRFIGVVRPLNSTDGFSRPERVRPLVVGASIGHVHVPVGSIGAFVSAGGVPCLLSNNHVLAAENRARIGDPIIQPASVDGGREPGDLVGTLHRFVPLRWDQPNHVDAAIAALAPGTDCEPGTLQGMGMLAHGRLSGRSMCERGATVYKIGRSTGVTQGRVTSCEFGDLPISYEDGRAMFERQIEIEPVGCRVFADAGDSGSIVVDADGLAIGLVFAGDSASPGLTYANPIGRVLSELDATLLF